MNLLSGEVVRDGGKLRMVGPMKKRDVKVIDAVNKADAIVPIDGFIYLLSYGNEIVQVVWWQITESGGYNISVYQCAEGPDSDILSRRVWYLIISDVVYCIHTRNGELQVITHQLKHRYMKKGITNDEFVDMTTEGLVMKVTVFDGHCTETPVERGAEFDDWLVNAWPTVVSHRDGITRISRGSHIFADIEFTPTHASWVHYHTYALIDGTEVRIAKIADFTNKVEYATYQLESPMIQLLDTRVLCEDGTIWELGFADPPWLVDRVSEVIYPPRRKQPTY